MQMRLTRDDIWRAGDAHMLSWKRGSVILRHHLVGDELMVQAGIGHSLKGVQPLCQNPAQVHRRLKAACGDVASLWCVFGFFAFVFPTWGSFCM